MKILWVNPSFLDYRVPVYKGLFDLNKANFFLLYSKKRVPERVITKIENAIAHNAIGLTGETILYFSGSSEFANSDLRLPYQKGLYKAIAKVNADILIGEGFFQWTPMALLYAKLHRKMFFIAYERTAHTERNCPKWRSLYRKFISFFVDGYLVNGILTKEYLLQMRVSEKKIFIGGMSADSENLAKNVTTCTIKERQTLKTQLSINNGLTFLYVGRINEPKGVFCLLNAWRYHIKNYPTDSLIIIGTGPLYEQYAAEFSAFKSIKICGAVDYDTIYLYYVIADVFVMPTLEDNWSLVVSEAMACGLPIACSIYNGCYPELVHDSINGKRFDPLNELDFIETLAYFHKVNLKEFGQESISIEKKFGSDIVSENIFKACNEIYRNG